MNGWEILNLITGGLNAIGAIVAAGLAWGIYRRDYGERLRLLPEDYLLKADAKNPDPSRKRELNLAVRVVNLSRAPMVIVNCGLYSGFWPFRKLIGLNDYVDLMPGGYRAPGAPEPWEMPPLTSHVLDPSVPKRFDFTTYANSYPSVRWVRGVFFESSSGKRFYATSAGFKRWRQARMTGGGVK